MHVYPAPRIQNVNPTRVKTKRGLFDHRTGNLDDFGAEWVGFFGVDDNGAGQFDVTLPPDYLVALGGQTVQTFTFQGTIEYEDVGLTCVSNNTLDLNRRLAPLSDWTTQVVLQETW